MQQIQNFFVGLSLAVACLLGMLGCGHTSHKYDTTVPIVEEYNPPPNEERYNNPPEASYRKPPVKKEDNVRQGIGPQGPSMGNGGMGGMGGQPGGFGQGR